MSLKKRKIKTSKGVYEFQGLPIYFGRKIMDVAVAEQNLLDFKMVMDSNKVKFGLIYGTLLGVIRDNALISYDEDIDVFILDDEKNKFMDTLFELRNLGFEVARYKGGLLTVIKRNEYIDISFFKKDKQGSHRSGKVSVPSFFFENEAHISFLNNSFIIPYKAEDFLEVSYGADWQIAKEKSPAKVANGILGFKRKLSRVLPGFVNLFIIKVLDVLRS